MDDKLLSIITMLVSLGIGIFNFLKHRHMERDMKNFPLHIALEISFADDFEPQVTIKSVTRAKSRAYPSGIPEPSQP
jgi:hypothetical protein